MLYFYSGNIATKCKNTTFLKNAQKKTTAALTSGSGKIKIL